MIITSKKIILCRLVFLGVISLCFTKISPAQNLNTKQQYDFVKYLLANDLKHDAITWGRNVDCILQDYTDSQRDSLRFLQGWTFYSVKDLEKARQSFDLVESASPLYINAICLSSLQSLHLGDIESAKDKLKQIDDYHENIVFEELGICLLERNFPRYDSLRLGFTPSSTLITNYLNQMDTLSLLLKSKKEKSPFLAATLSSVIPGLGKIYAGKVGEGISSFIATGTFATLCAENWIHHGITSWKTIGFGLLGAVFYIGNIYSSVITVKLDYKEFNDRKNLEILYNIHIPIRELARP